MKKYIGKILPIFIIITIALTIIETAYAAAAPLWQQSSFVNAGQASYASNQGLVNSITQFHAQYLQNYRRVCNNNCCKDKSAAFRQVLVQGFQQDALLQVKPFNIDFIYGVLQNVVFCFSAPQPNTGSVGLYISGINAQHSRIWANPDRRTSELFARTVIHELGHAFGLGETLADLKAESFLGQAHSARPNSNLAYNTTFDRMLLAAVGPERFWEAAYHSNAAFGQLWDEVFGNVITHTELEIVRGVVMASLTTNAGLRDTFQATKNITLDAASTLIHESFVSIDQNSLDSAAEQEALDELRTWVELYVFMAQEGSLRPSNSVHDWIINNHHVRFN